jgi:hypothetical protein
MADWRFFRDSELVLRSSAYTAAIFDVASGMGKFLQNFDAQQRTLISVAVGIVVFLLTSTLHHLPLQLILSWNAFAVTAILLALILALAINLASSLIG